MFLTSGPITTSVIIFVIVLQIMLFRSRWGLRTRAVGEHPRAADTVGIDVIRVRYRNVILGGIFAGLAGAWLTLEFNASFQNGMSANRGFIALAAVIFGRWTPIGAFGGALLFMFSEALGIAIRSNPPPGDLGVFLSGIQGELPEPLQQRVRRPAVPAHDHRACRGHRQERRACRGRPPIRQGRRLLTSGRSRRPDARLPGSGRRSRPRPRARRRGHRRCPANRTPDRRRRRILERGAAIVRRLSLPRPPGLRVRAGQPERAGRPGHPVVQDPRRGPSRRPVHSTSSMSSAVRSCASPTPWRRSRPRPAASGCNSGS